jgi:hypothetical protein
MLHPQPHYGEVRRSGSEPLTTTHQPGRFPVLGLGGISSVPWPSGDCHVEAVSCGPGQWPSSGPFLVTTSSSDNIEPVCQLFKQKLSRGLSGSGKIRRGSGQGSLPRTRIQRTTVDCSMDILEKQQGAVDIMRAFHCHQKCS